MASNSPIPIIYKDSGEEDLGSISGGHDDMLRQFAEMTVQLRKNIQEETLQKRWNVPSADLTYEEGDKLTQANLQLLVSQASSADPVVQYEAVTSVRKFLSCDINQPIEAFINCGIIPILVRCLNSPNAALQHEATWALTNIASGTSDQTHAVARSGAVPHFIQFLSSKDQNVCEQAVWALGNIIGDGPELLNTVISLGVVKPLLKLIQPDIPITFLRNITWVIMNLCRNKDYTTPQQTLRDILPTLKVLLEHPDTNVLIDVAWALSYIADEGMNHTYPKTLLGVNVL